MTRTLATTLVLLVAGLAAGCGGRYAGASDRAYDIATALVSACNRKSEPALAAVVEQIEQGRADSSLSTGEVAYLSEIVATARGGDWATAEATARQVLKDQVVD